MTHYGPEPLPDRDPTPPNDERVRAKCPGCGREFECNPYTDPRNGTPFHRCPHCQCEVAFMSRVDDPDDWSYYPPHDPDADPCRCVDCCEREWTRLQEAQAESPSEWNQAYKGPIDKREMRRRE